MIRFLKAAVRGVRNELAAGQSGWVDAQDAFGWSFGGQSTPSGQTVSPKTALKLSVAWDCTKKTSQLIATLPGALYRKREDGSKEMISDSLAEILTSSPNSKQTAPEFWEGMVAPLLLKGNSVSERLFLGSKLVGVSPLPAFAPCINPRTRALEYVGYDRGQRVVMPPEKVFHLRGFGADNGIGMSTISYGANSIGAALGADETASSVFSNAMMAAGIVSSEQTLNEGQRGQLQTLLDQYVGSKRAGKILTLEAGLQYKQLQMNPEDAQLLDTRRFNVEDVCRWFGVPPIIVGHASEGQTMWGSGVEAIMLSWLTTGINPLLRMIEARIRKDLIPADKRRQWFFEFNREAMLQMDSKAKGDFLLKMRMGGFMSGDEGRDKLNLPRRGGNNDELVVQTSMGLVDFLGKDETK